MIRSTSPNVTYLVPYRYTSALSVHLTCNIRANVTLGHFSCNIRAKSALMLHLGCPNVTRSALRLHLECPNVTPVPDPENACLTVMAAQAKAVGVTTMDENSRIYLFVGIKCLNEKAENHNKRFVSTFYCFSIVFFIVNDTQKRFPLAIK